MVLSVKTTRHGSPSKEAALAEAGRDDRVRLNATVSRSLRDRLKVRAIAERCTVTDLLIRLAEEYLSGCSKE